MRKILIIIATILFIPTMVWAGSWATHCENGSCETKSGKIAVYWQAEDINTRMYFGRLTGVEGLPISIEDFESAEKRLNQSFDKSISYKKSQEANVKGSIPGVEGVSGGAGAGDSGEMGFTKKKSMDIGKSKGQRVSVNYTLDFVKWIGDTRFSNSQFEKPGDIGRYPTAAEAILNWYYDNTLQIPLADYMFRRGEPEKLGEIPIDTPLDDDTKELVLAKYISLVYFAGVKETKERYIKSYYNAVLLINNTNKEDTELLAEINKKYKQHIDNLKVLMGPGETAQDLYGRLPKLALAKWIGDTNTDTSLLPKDRYIIGLSMVDAFENPKYPEAEKKKFQNEFESAIKTKDKSITIVTVPKPPAKEQLKEELSKLTPTQWIIPIGVFGTVLCSLGGYILYRKFFLTKVR